MKSIKINIHGCIILAIIIICSVGLVFCGSRTGKEMKDKEVKSAIPAEEASWTESQTGNKGWYKNFKVIE
jgi:hypothetical protein